MAGRDLAAKRYAQAAFQIALESGALGRWADDLESMAAVMSNPEAAAILESVRLPLPAKYRLLNQTLGSLDPKVVNLAKLLVAKGRGGLGNQIREQFQALLDAQRGLDHAVVTTAVPLSDAEREAVIQKLSQVTGRQVALRAQVDAAIIGGLVARIGDTLIDGSVRGRLQALRRSLRGGAG